MRSATIKRTTKETDISLPLCTCDFLAKVTFSGNTCTLDMMKGNTASWNIVLPEGMSLRINK